MKLLNFIGGEFVASEGQKTFIKKSPFDGSELAQVTQSDAMDVIKALQGAKKALQQSENQSSEERASLLLKMASHLEANADHYAFLEALYQGLSKNFVLENSIKVAIHHLRDNAESLRQPLGKSVLVQASGIVGLITPWCLSLRVAMERLAPALAAGNAVMWKVSEFSPITAQIVGEVLQAAQAPNGLVQILQGGPETAQLIAAHPGIRAVTAVGRSSTVESVAKAGLTQLKKLQLGGGAKNSAIVLADFDYQTHLPEIMQSFLVGQGQMCWNSSRLFIPESIQKEFMLVLQGYLDSLQPLQSPEGDSPWTPLISDEQVTSITERSQFGVSEHGKIFWGSRRLEQTGFFVKPTVMIDLPNCSVLQQDELHGPLILVTPVKYQHEAVKWANTSYLGHSTIVWGSEEKSQKVTGKLECSQIWLNSWLNGQSNIIFGHKQSGFGNPDMRWNGTFYSDVKKLTGL